ncbi:MAG: glycosyl hydrolase family 25 [Prevotellaceae bacterium]|nr:glycosyl hydrolase family 25 [Prevotellaceae bacterium]
MNRPRRPYALLAFAMLFMLTCIVQPAEAKKRKTKYEQKRATSAVIPTIEPDGVSQRSKPDTHPHTLAAPMFAGLNNRPVRVSNDGRPSPNRGITGIDVSHYQGQINWAEVARDPQVQYVFLKMTEGNSMVDNTYAYNLREARRHGLKVGVYHFFRANVTAEAQFRNFMSVYRKQDQDLLPFVDVELSNGVSDHVFVSRLRELLELITKAIGRRPVIYTGKHYYQKYLNTDYFRQYQYFIASYTAQPPMLANNDDYTIWQYSSKGRVRGIRGDVDMSCFMGKHVLKEIMF